MAKMSRLHTRQVTTGEVWKVKRGRKTVSEKNKKETAADVIIIQQHHFSLRLVNRSKGRNKRLVDQTKLWTVSNNETCNKEEEPVETIPSRQENARGLTEKKNQRNTKCIKRIKEMKRTTKANRQTMRAPLKHHEVRRRERKVTCLFLTIRRVRCKEYNLASIRMHLSKK